MFLLKMYVCWPGFVYNQKQFSQLDAIVWELLSYAYALSINKYKMWNRKFETLFNTISVSIIYTLTITFHKFFV